MLLAGPTSRIDRLFSRSSRLAAAVALLAVALATPVCAQHPPTQDAFDRLEELLELRRDDGLLDTREILPAILVRATPRYAQSEGWFQTQALASLLTAFGDGTIRVCEACSQPRTQVQGDRLVQDSGPVSLDELIELDSRYRGKSARAKTAIWLDETATGIAVRITDLSSARVVFAQNIDPQLREYEGAARTFRLSAELERRTRGDSLTHAIFDAAVLTGAHVAMEWVEQWGETNNNLTGVVLSFVDPVVGIGASFHRVLQWQNVSVGIQGLVSLPTAIARGQGSQTDVIDPLLTGVAVARWPLFGKYSNYAAVATASTNGQFALGISLLNTSFIPLLP